MDTSALVKRYFLEQGSSWVQSLADPRSGHSIVLAEITMVETAAAFAAKHRARGGISRRERDDALNLMLRHCNTEYGLIPISRTILDRAVLLTQDYRLRGYDAVQFATALVINEQYVAAGLPALTIISADNDLLAAAQGENLAVDNPLAHP